MHNDMVPNPISCKSTLLGKLLTVTEGYLSLMVMGCIEQIPQNIVSETFMFFSVAMFEPGILKTGLFLAGIKFNTRKMVDVICIWGFLKETYKLQVLLQVL